MKSTFVILAMCALVGGLVGAVYAGTGPDLLIPQINPANITLDGLGTDWENPAIYPQEYMLTRDDLGGDATGGEMPPVDDWDGILYLGWSAPPDNMLYGYSRVNDDILNDECATNGGSWQDDGIEFVIDGDNSGGDYRTGYATHAETAMQLGIRMTQVPLPHGPGGNETNTQEHIWANAEAEWLSGPEYLLAALQHPTTRENCTYAYEWKMAVWDVTGTSAAESQRHTNTLGDVIGLLVQWDDSDAELDKRDNQPATCGPEGNAGWTNADHCNDAYFVEGLVVAVEPTSWGSVKASFK